MWQRGVTRQCECGGEGCDTFGEVSSGNCQISQVANVLVGWSGNDGGGSRSGIGGDDCGW